MFRRAGHRLFTRLFKKIWEDERMPDEWRRSVLVLIFKNTVKGITIMDTLTSEIWKTIPWELIFADDVALMATTEELQEKVIRRQEAIRKGGLKINAQKSEEMICEKNGNTEIKVTDQGGSELKQVQKFKYLGSEMAAEEGSLMAVKQRITAAWSKWREVTGIICDKKMPRKLKCNVYKTVIRPSLLYGSECWTVGEKEEDLINRTEMGMLRWILGMSRQDKIRNEEIEEDVVWRISQRR